MTHQLTKNILCFTISNDPHLDRVVSFLDKKKVTLTRVDTDGAINGAATRLNINNSSARIVTQAQEFSLNDFQAIWFRKPYLDIFTPDDKYKADEFLYKYLFNEVKRTIPYFLESRLHQPFILCPIHTPIVHNVLYQLAQASALGFTVPEYIVSTDIKEIGKFVSRFTRVLSKPTNPSSITMKDGYTPLGSIVFDYQTYLKKYAGMKLKYPMFLQEYIEKQFELRITVVGKKIFACKIDSQKRTTSCENWKYADPYKVPHEKYKLPLQIEERILTYCKNLKQNYAAIDMVVTPENN